MAALALPPSDETQRIINLRLVNAMAAVAEDDNLETRRSLYEALFDSTLILPAAESLGDSATPQRRAVARDETLRLIAYENADGTPILLAFTDEDAVLAWQPEGTPYVALRAPDIFRLAVHNQIAEIVLNLAGPVKGYITHDELVDLAAGRIPTDRPVSTEQIPVGTTVLISRPAEPLPEAWLDELREVLTRHPKIIAAYPFQLQVGREAPRSVIGITFDPGTDKATQDGVMRALLGDVGQGLQEGEQMDFIILDAGDFLRIVQDTVSPLYRRSHGDEE